MRALSSYKDCIFTAPDNISFSLDGKKPVLRVVNGALHDYPVRRSFVAKLMKWHLLGEWALKHASNDTSISYLNDLLCSIRAAKVRIYLENNSAATITSDRFTEFRDDEVIEACREFGIDRISHSERLLRIDSHMISNFQPVPGDDCGFGFSVFNSETGFHALQVSHYILRYACSNGLIKKIPLTNDEKPIPIHYNQSTEELRSFLDRQLGKISTTRKEIEHQLIIAASRKPSPEMRKIANTLLRSVNNAKMVKQEIADALTEWDVVNIITAHARQHPVDIRLSLERAAGNLLGE